MGDLAGIHSVLQSYGLEGVFPHFRDPGECFFLGASRGKHFQIVGQKASDNYDELLGRVEKYIKWRKPNAQGRLNLTQRAHE